MLLLLNLNIFFLLDAILMGFWKQKQYEENKGES